MTDLLVFECAVTRAVNTAPEAATATRRGFLVGLALLSAAAVPVAVQAAALDPWDRLSVALTIIDERLPRAVSHARNAGMKPEWIFSVMSVPGGTAAILFELPDNKGSRTFYYDGEESGRGGNAHG